jgi:hypothetical protein
MFTHYPMKWERAARCRAPETGRGHKTVINPNKAAGMALPRRWESNSVERFIPDPFAMNMRGLMLVHRLLQQCPEIWRCLG